MSETYLLTDVRTLVYRLHGYWISQDFALYDENRRYLYSIIQQYDTLCLQQAIFYIDYEIFNDIQKLVKLPKEEKAQREKIMEHKKAFKALKTVIQKTLAPRLSINKE